MEEKDWIYLAGYIDGDGCFYMDYVKHRNPEKKPHHRCVLKFASVDEEQIKYVCSLFGNKYWVKAKGKQQLENPNRKPVYECNVSGESLDTVLPKILPHLRIKKRHCEIMIKMRKTYTNPINGGYCIQVPDDVYELRHQLYLALRSINTHQSGRYRTCPLSPLAMQQAGRLLSQLEQIYPGLES